MQKEAMKNFEKELPENYKLVKAIDAKEARIGILINMIALVVLLVCMVTAYFIIGVPLKEMLTVEEGANPFINLFKVLIWGILLILYIILHELVHGVVYKITTKQKLTFGFTLSVAYCGVPKIYVYRKTALLAVLAPFVVFLPIFLAVCFILKNPLEQMLAVALLGMHIGGCSGDLWVTGILLFQLRDKRTLMNDTGPKQTFYVPNEEN
ncbi:MAG: DUF3267 domain-containing protein [Anaeroplasmataceae bacterium]|nr:DUF3267 domain-containing protein [Anaeroplasmataceae bacterium]